MQCPIAQKCTGCIDFHPAQQSTWFRYVSINRNRDAIFPDMSNSLSQVYKPSQFAVQFTVIHAINIHSNISNRSN